MDSRKKQSPNWIYEYEKEQNTPTGTTKRKLTTTNGYPISFIDLGYVRLRTYFVTQTLEFPLKPAIPYLMYLIHGSTMTTTYMHIVAYMKWSAKLAIEHMWDKQAEAKNKI
jgi:hypothetical protein